MGTHTHSHTHTYIQTQLKLDPYLSPCSKIKRSNTLMQDSKPATPKERYVGTGKDILNMTPIAQEWIA